MKNKPFTRKRNRRASGSFFPFGLLIVAAVLLASQARGRGKPLKRPITIAHRGANMLADENTLKAYTLAADHGMDYFECDPRLTTDGVFVLMHDDSAKRTTGRDVKISRMTLDEVRALRTRGGEPIPTLEEAFALAKEKDVRMYLDTKLTDIPSMEKLLEVVVRNNMRDRVMVGLWTREQQEWMQREHPDVATSLAYPAPVPSLSKVAEIGAEWVGMLEVQATPAVIKKADKLGLNVVTMPLNDRRAIIAKINDGMQVIQTDDAVLLEQIIDELFGDKNQ